MITQHTRPVFERLQSEIAHRRTPGRPFVIGITGLDCAGKTRFAQAFQELLESQDETSQLIHLDDFLHPR